MMSPRLHLFLPLYSLSLYVFTFFSFAAARHVFKRALQTEAWIIFIVDLIWGCSLGTWRQIRQKRKNWLLLSTQLCEQWTPFLISPSSILQLQSSSVIMQLCVMLLALHISSPYVSPETLAIPPALVLTDRAASFSKLDWFMLPQNPLSLCFE